MGHSEAPERSHFPGCPLRRFQPSGFYPQATDNMSKLTEFFRDALHFSFWLFLCSAGHNHELSSGTKNQVRKNSLNRKFWGGIFLGHPGPRRRDIPDKNFIQVAPFCCFIQGSRRDVPGFGSGRPGLGKTLCKKTLG